MRPTGYLATLESHLHDAELRVLHGPHVLQDDRQQLQGRAERDGQADPEVAIQNVGARHVHKAVHVQESVHPLEHHAPGASEGEEAGRCGLGRHRAWPCIATKRVSSGCRLMLAVPQTKEV